MDSGHAAYIYSLYAHHSLPTSYNFQFYQPPLFHILVTAVMRFFSLFHPNADIYTLFDTGKLVSCFASCCSLLLIRRICQELKCIPEVTCLVVGLMAFHPNFYLLAGRINNDSLSVAFILLSCLMLIQWYQNRRLAYLIGLALGIGLGMMTKLNVGILALLAGPVMLYVFWQAIKKGTWKRQLADYVIFLIICAPLGLWYSTRNLLRFGQPLGYVHNVDGEAVSFLYRGNYSIFERFFSIPLEQYQQNIYIDISTDYNLPLYLLRSSLFGEFRFDNLDWVARALLNINILLIILSLIAMIVIILKGKEYSPVLRYGCGLLWLILMISYILFNIKHPDSCTMDFRYIVPTCICGAIYLAAFWQKIRRVTLTEKSLFLRYTSLGLTWLIPICCSLFALLSAYMFSNLS